VRQAPSTKAKANPSPAESEDEQDSAGDEFDAEQAASALDDAAQRASSCRKESDPSGVALVTITFAPSGRVTRTMLSGPPFMGTPTGSCIVNAMRGAKISPFAGKHVTVRKTVTIQ
jgi:hypothetical protein